MFRRKWFPGSFERFREKVKGFWSAAPTISWCVLPVAVTPFPATTSSVLLQRVEEFQSIGHCPNVGLFQNNEERKIQVSWDERDQKKYIVPLQITSEDRPGLLHEIAEALTASGANVVEVSLKTTQQDAQGIFKIEIQNRNQLKQIFRRIQKIKGIRQVTRTKDVIDLTDGEEAADNG